MIVFEALAAHHDLTRFRSGNSKLDDYLRREALERQRRGEARVFVLLDTEEGNNRPLGYIALAATGYYVPEIDRCNCGARDFSVHGDAFFPRS